MQRAPIPIPAPAPRGKWEQSNRRSRGNLVHHADDAALHRELAGSRDPEELADAGALAQDENGVALSCAARPIDGEEGVSGRLAGLVHRLHDEELEPAEGFVLLGGNDGAEDLAERHAPAASLDASAFGSGPSQAKPAPPLDASAFGSGPSQAKPAPPTIPTMAASTGTKD